MVIGNLPHLVERKRKELGAAGTQLEPGSKGDGRRQCDYLLSPYSWSDIRDYISVRLLDVVRINPITLVVNRNFYTAIVIVKAYLPRRGSLK